MDAPIRSCVDMELTKLLLSRTETHLIEQSHFEHYILCHTPLPDSEFLIELLTNETADIFVHAKHFL